MKTLFEELVKKGYQVHNKRVLGDPKHTSEETKSKDAIQELALAIEWIRVNFGIWITVTSISQESWQCHMTKKGDSLGKCYLEDFYTPSEATEAALLHTLQNLII